MSTGATTKPLKNKEAAKRGGKIAGSARKEIEEATGMPVVSSDNYLTERQRINNAKDLPAEFNEVIDQMLKAPPVDNKDLKTKPS